MPPSPLRKNLPNVEKGDGDGDGDGDGYTSSDNFALADSGHQDRKQNTIVGGGT